MARPQLVRRDKHPSGREAAGPRRRWPGGCRKHWRHSGTEAQRTRSAFGPQDACVGRRCAGGASGNGPSKRCVHAMPSTRESVSNWQSREDVSPMKGSTLRRKERARLETLNRVSEGQLRAGEAAAVLGVSGFLIVVLVTGRCVVGEPAKQWNDESGAQDRNCTLPEGDSRFRAP